MLPQQPLIGNDIVDIQNLANRASSLNPAYIARVFSRREQKTFQNSGNSMRIFAMFWAAKESMFKLLQKSSGELIFAHAQFEAFLPLAEAESIGHGKYLNIDFELSWKCTEDYVHCLASAVFPVPERHLNLNYCKHFEVVEISSFDFSGAEEDFSDSEFLLSRESRVVRQMAKNLLHEKFGLQQVGIRKFADSSATRIPYVYSLSPEIGEIDISLSHDHRYAAVGIAKREHYPNF